MTYEGSFVRRQRDLKDRLLQGRHLVDQWEANFEAWQQSTANRKADCAELLRRMLVLTVLGGLAMFIWFPLLAVLCGGAIGVGIHGLFVTWQWKKETDRYVQHGRHLRERLQQLNADD